MIYVIWFSLSKVPQKMKLNILLVCLDVSNIKRIFTLIRWVLGFEVKLIPDPEYIQNFKY